MPAGQPKDSAPSRSAQRGKECDPRKSRSFSHAPDRHSKSQDYRLGPRQRIERVARRAAHKRFSTTVGYIALHKWQVQTTNRLLGQARSGI